MNHELQHTALDNYRGKRTGKQNTTADGFNTLGLHPLLRKGIAQLNFTQPTPIQEKSIPVALNGQDIIAIAKTGSGKTLAYGLPILQQLAKQKRGIGLIIVPTRELALQVEESLLSFERQMKIRSTVLIGGASMITQRNQLRKNPRMIIATPGRLLDHLERKTIDLSFVTHFVLDEADRMLDMGFIPDIKKVIKAFSGKRQTLLFSATMPPEIETIAEKLMTAPQRIEIDRTGTTPTEVNQEMFVINNKDKSRLLAHHLKQKTGPVLVFTRTKRMASRLTAKVNDMGFTAAEIHSDRSLGQRRNALEGFKRGRYRILIATDIAARGIDVSDIELVVNYDMPANSEDYVHRIGRTGRAGKSGHAISFANTAQKRSIRSLERFINTRLNITKTPALQSEKALFREADETKKSERILTAPAPSKNSNKKKETPKKPYENKFESKNSGKTKKSFVKKNKSESKKTTKPTQKTSSEEPFWTIFTKNRPTKKKFSSNKPKRKRHNK